ncbi:MAG: beta-galactosidase [Ferruginibacter sp.]
MKKTLLICLAALLSFILLALPSFGQKHSFSLGKDDFLLDGKPLQIISGELHPARIPHEYWRHRIQMTRAMGCNTVALYVFWNYHEAAPGIFDFSTGNHNIAEFIRICQEEGMWVLFRPGPYVCGEWDFGGLPPYLLKFPDIKIRCMDSRYMAAVSRYVNRMSKEIRPLLCTNGGPILMVQVENEYGSFGNDRTYMNAMKKLWVTNGIDVPFYTADGPTAFMLEAGSLPGVAVGLDSGSSEDDFTTAKKANPGVPVFSSETYPGWLTHWGEKWARPDTANLKKEIEFLLKHKKSFNFYVIHGGTNFGFTAGANAFKATEYQPDITSYDYDAPINEQGQPTAKYYMLRNLISQYVNYPIPDIPAAKKTIEIPALTLSAFTTVWDNLPKPIITPQPQPMESFNQHGGGYILYRTKLVGHKSGRLQIFEPHDYALVFLNGKLIDTVFRDGGNWTVNLPKTDVANPQLDILVEGMGRLNFAQFMIDRKGITDRVSLNGMTLMNWETFSLPMEDKIIAALKPARVKETDNGIFFKGSFQLDETGDTFIDMSNYKKGVVWVNGHNLGRYWYIGPQFRLYCPASWLQKGKNEIVVFDVLQQTAAAVSGKKTLE